MIGLWAYSNTGTPGTDTLNPRNDTLSIFLSLRILVAKLSTDTQSEYRYPRHKYRYPLHQKGSNGWKMSPTAPNNSQRSPTARYTIETIKQASKHQEKTNASLYCWDIIRKN
ncbi:hypothetical protein V6N13_114154 [Hibiscus sabdariffa]